MYNAAIQHFCNRFNLPDLSPLAGDNFPERHAVVWRLMQARLSADRQYAFLLQFCRGSDVAALRSLGVIAKSNMSVDDCSKMMEVIACVVGFNKDALSDAMKAFCAREPLPGLVTLLERFGAKNVVYCIESLFPVDPVMREALDVLKFDVDPERFVSELGRAIQANKTEYDEQMRELRVRWAELQTERDSLEQDIGSPIIGVKRSRAAVL